MFIYISLCDGVEVGLEWFSSRATSVRAEQSETQGLQILFRSKQMVFRDRSHNLKHLGFCESAKSVHFSLCGGVEVGTRQSKRARNGSVGGRLPLEPNSLEGRTEIDAHRMVQYPCPYVLWERVLLAQLRDLIRERGCIQGRDIRVLVSLGLGGSMEMANSGVKLCL